VHHMSVVQLYKFECVLAYTVAVTSVVYFPLTHLLFSLTGVQLIAGGMDLITRMFIHTFFHANLLRIVCTWFFSGQAKQIVKPVRFFPLVPLGHSDSFTVQALTLVGYSVLVYIFTHGVMVL